jgi:hypothetical protein
VQVAGVAHQALVTPMAGTLAAAPVGAAQRLSARQAPEGPRWGEKGCWELRPGPAGTRLDETAQEQPAERAQDQLALWSTMPPGATTSPQVKEEVADQKVPLEVLAAPAGRQRE